MKISSEELKNWRRDFLKNSLRVLARWTIARFRPGVIGVTGSVGKTSTKLAIAAVMQSGRHVRYSKGNLNNEFGVPLTVLGDWREDELRLISREAPPEATYLRKMTFWMKVLVLSFLNLIFGTRGSYPEIIVLEYGADRPGDIKYLLNIARPVVSVITAIGEIPVHVEFYSSVSEVAKEKGRLVDQLPAAGCAVLNADDPAVSNMSNRTRGRVITFGFSDKAEVKIIAFENKFENGRPSGVVFKLEYGGSTVPVRIERVFGRPHAYSAAAAASVGLLYGFNLVAISEALKNYKPAPERMQVMDGLNKSLILDDAYNASPLSMMAALETLGDMQAKRKIAVLGDMRELGDFTFEAHKKIGMRAAEVAQIIVAVGENRKILVQGAGEAKKSKTVIADFATAEEAAEFMKIKIEDGDVVLIKASHAVRLDKVASALALKDQV